MSITTGDGNFIRGSSGVTNSGTSSNPSSDKSELMQQIDSMITEEFANGGNEDVSLLKVADRLGVSDKSVVFFGFQGLLTNSFSLIPVIDQEEVRMRCFALDDSISPVFMSVVEFYKFFSKYDQPKGTLKAVKFDEAMATLRVGEKISRSESKFEDVDEEEFDDNCTDQCLPGNHHCGK